MRDGAAGHRRKAEISLARQAGLEIGALGWYSALQIKCKLVMTISGRWVMPLKFKILSPGEWSLIPLAGPANRQGRIAADVIMGRKSSFRGVQGTMVCKVFNNVVAATGVSEKTLLRLKTNGKEIPYEKVYIHPGSHASYYPEQRQLP